MRKIKKLSMNTMLVLMLAGAVTALTLVIRIATPATGGYLNLGDVGVIFCGLFLGRRWGAVAGGIGSALADIVGGFFLFAPITLLAKGLEAFVAGWLGKKNPWWLALACGCMVLVYFLAEVIMPGMGWHAAFNELPLNLTQGGIGAAGGWLIYRSASEALPKKNKLNPDGTLKDV
jgi:uncharacterized membrane protein